MPRGMSAMTTMTKPPKSANIVAIPPWRMMGWGSSWMSESRSATSAMESMASTC